MNAESVTSWLLAVGVPAGVISVGAEADNAWCLLRQEQPADAETGEVAVTWEVFWREQGNRYDWARFTNEQVACHYLFGRLAWAQVARGAVGVLPDVADDSGGPAGVASSNTGSDPATTPNKRQAQAEDAAGAAISTSS